MNYELISNINKINNSTNFWLLKYSFSMFFVFLPLLNVRFWTWTVFECCSSNTRYSHNILSSFYNVFLSKLKFLMSIMLTELPNQKTLVYYVLISLQSSTAMIDQLLYFGYKWSDLRSPGLKVVRDTTRSLVCILNFLPTLKVYVEWNSNSILKFSCSLFLKGTSFLFHRWML